MTNYSSPYSASRRWWRGNLHLHTCCGTYADLAESGPRYAQHGYAFLAVTDHDRSPDSATWARWSAEASLVLIPGVERSVPEHMLDIGRQQVGAVVEGDYAASARLLRDGGGFIVGCHPQEYAEGAQRIRAGAPALHALEIYNGLRASRGCDEAANVILWDELLTAGMRIWGVATDDYHLDYITPGHGWVCVQAGDTPEAPTWPQLVTRLKAGAFYASTGPAFASLGWDGQVLHATADADTEGMRVIGPGGAVLHAAVGCTLAWPLADGPRYLRVEAMRGETRAWSQPFFAEDA